MNPIRDYLFNNIEQLYDFFNIAKLKQNCSMKSVERTIAQNILFVHPSTIQYEELDQTGSVRYNTALLEP